jgi:hypothetical protein
LISKQLKKSRKLFIADKSKIGLVPVSFNKTIESFIRDQNCYLFNKDGDFMDQLKEREEHFLVYIDHDGIFDSSFIYRFYWTGSSIMEFGDDIVYDLELSVYSAGLQYFIPDVVGLGFYMDRLQYSIRMMDGDLYIDILRDDIDCVDCLKGYYYPVIYTDKGYILKDMIHVLGYKRKAGYYLSADFTLVYIADRHINRVYPKRV